MLSAMVLAAGAGTRLRPLTDECAKPLVPVGDRPALAHVLDRLRAAGLSRIVVNAHHRAGDIRAFLGASGARLSEEEELLGTAGGIARAAALLGGGAVLVWNADVLADVDLRALIAWHEKGDGEATLVVQRCPRGKGPIGVGEQGRIVRLRRERLGDEAFACEFLGVSVLGPALRDRLPPRGCLVGDVLIPALRGGASLTPYFHEASWHDIGTPPTYLTANLAWLDARRLEVWTGDDVSVASGIALDRVVLGSGASVLGAGRLTRCVVWPGARASAPLTDAVVTRNGVVRVEG